MTVRARNTSAAPRLRTAPQGSEEETSGTDPDPNPPRPTGAPELTCTNCGDQLDRNRGARAGRCGTCSTYRYRHGHDRPLDLIIRLTKRDIEQELTRRRPVG
jgi:hypothetical protein